MPHASEVAVGVLQAELPSGKVVAELVVKVPIVNWEEVRDVWYTDISGCTGRQHGGPRTQAHDGMIALP